MPNRDSPASSLPALRGTPEAILAAAFRASRDALILFRAEDEMIVDVNDAWTRTTGLRREDVVGRSQRALDIWNDADSQRFAALMRAEGEVRDFRFSFQRRLPSGRAAVGHASLTAQPIVLEGTTYFLVAGRDMTVEVEAEQQRQQSRRLEELGRLAGGVAHDFNNMLTVIGAYAAMVREVAARGAAPPVDDLDQILGAAARATELSRRLLAFSRHQVIEPRPVDLNEVVDDEVRLLARLIGEQVQLSTELAPSLPPVLADPSQLAQVMMNLVVNARDAMDGGGVLTIRTFSRRIDGASPGSDAVRELRPAEYVVLEVADSGSGMDAHTLERIFEPFFTTKPPGQGTGLGLAMVYGIVKQAGGAIEVETAPGEGSVFRLYWPLATAADPLRARPEAAFTPWSGAGRVLLTEDDEGVRIAVCRMLEDRGFEVVEARNGAEALKRIDAQSDANAEPFDVVLTDVVMPVLGGRELAERLAELAPAVPVVMMTGFSDRENVRAGLPNVVGPVLAKPFTADALARAMAHALASTRVAGD